MEFLTTLQYRLRQLRGQMQRRVRDTELIDETWGIESLIEQESSRLRATGARVPTRAVTDLDMAKIPEIFKLQRALTYESEFTVPQEEMVPFPKCLDTSLEAYHQATGGSPPNEAFCRTRIDSILLHTLAAMKAQEEHNPRASLASLRSVRSLHIQFETDLSLPWILHREGPRIIRGRINYSVWYIQPGSLETNCVMVEAKREDGVSQGVKQCLACMAMVYWARKKAELADLSVWGIATDSWTWCFIHIRPDGTYASQWFDWHNQAPHIISILHKIYQRVGQTGQPPTRNKRWTATSGLSIGSVYHDAVTMQPGEED